MKEEDENPTETGDAGIMKWFMITFVALVYIFIFLKVLFF